MFPGLASQLEVTVEAAHLAPIRSMTYMTIIIYISSKL